MQHRAVWIGGAFVAGTLAAIPGATQTLAPRPYQPVAIVMPAPSVDAEFNAFRQELIAVAKGRVYADLARLVDPRFFWDRDYDRAFDARKPGVDNLAAAIRLEHGDGAGWTALAALAAEDAAAPLVSRPGVGCAPAPPDYDGIAFTRLLDDTRTDAPEWAYPRADNAPVRAEPKPVAQPVGTLGMHLVRVLRTGEADDAADTGRRWQKLALPSGAIGFVPPDVVTSLAAPRLCYAQDSLGRWRIAGYIAAGR